MVTVICIIGKTSTGKDTIAKYLESKYGASPVVSYTTRPARAGEMNDSLNDNEIRMRDSYLHDMFMKLLQNIVKIVATDSFNGFLPEIYNGYARLMEVDPCIPKAISIGCH